MIITSLSTASSRLVAYKQHLKLLASSSFGSVAHKDSPKILIVSIITIFTIRTIITYNQLWHHHHHHRDHLGGSQKDLIFKHLSEPGSWPAQHEVAVSSSLLPLVHPSEHCCRDGHLQVQTNPSGGRLIFLFQVNHTSKMLNTAVRCHCTDWYEI